MTGQMRSFLDQTGGLWVKGALVGKVGSVFVSTGTGGGNETTAASFHTTLLHHGMVIVGLPYALPETMDISAVRSEEHTSELQSLMRTPYAVFCLKKKTN